LSAIAKEIGCSHSTISNVLNPNTVEGKTCELCGKTMNTNAKVGVCQTTLECKKENQRRRHGTLARGPYQSCEWCEHPLSRRNKYGICRSNPECRLESIRRTREARIEKSKAYQHKYEAENRHDDLTYLMFSVGLKAYKIGYTKNLTARLRTLRCGCFDIELVTTFPYGRKLEKWLHKHFADRRIEGTEWFTDIAEIDVKDAVSEFEGTDGSSGKRVPKV